MLTNEQKGELFWEFTEKYTPNELLQRIEIETDTDILEVLNEVKKIHKYK